MNYRVETPKFKKTLEADDIEVTEQSIVFKKRLSGEFFYVTHVFIASETIITIIEDRDGNNK